MEDNKNNNIEAFFKKSMEAFNDEPSPEVWTALNARLDEESPSRFLLFFKKYMVWLVPALLIPSIYFISISDKVTLENPLSQIEESADIKKEKELKQTEIPQTELSIANLNNKDIIENALKNSNTTEQTNANEENIGINANAFNSEIKSEVSRPVIRKAPIKNNNQLDSPLIPTLNNSEVEKSKNANYGLGQNMQTDFPEPTDSKFEPKENGVSKKLNSLLSIQNLKQGSILHLLSNDRAIPSAGTFATDPIIINSNSMRGVYIAGLSVKFFNTFVKYSSGFNGSEGYGIRQEYKIGKSFALTNSIHFNVQHYDINVNSSPLDESIVGMYTRRSLDDLSVTSIESNSEFVDFSLGLKWMASSPEGRTRLFINPSLVWQLYMPQDFIFTQQNNSQLYRMDSRLILYLGSGRLNVGLEKALNKNVIVQLSLFGEASLRPIGIQNEKFKLLGIQSSILFGR